MKRLSFLIACFFASLAPDITKAQDWATKDVCTVKTPKIHDAAFRPTTLDALTTEAAQIENGTGRFWSVVAPNGATSHLWGTFHSSDPLILDLPKTVKDTVANARAVAVEIDFAFASRDDFRADQYQPLRFNEASDPFDFDKSGDTTIANLPPEISNWILARAIELGWTEDVELILSPAGIAEMLLGDPCEDFQGYTLPIQDDYIKLLGQLGGADIISLENRNDILTDLTASPDIADAIIAVYAAYLKPETTNAARATSFALYRQGQIGAMFAWDQSFIADTLGDIGPKALEQTNAYLLDHRNQRFLKRLEDELPKGGVFVATGTFHLPGQAGLVAQLRTQGYTVTRRVLPGETP